MRILLVTGTNTGVGKTIATAALAACALRNGEAVAVVKPVQTGVGPAEPGDLAEVQRLAGLTDVHEYVRYAEPLAPASAARRLGQTGPAIAELAGRIRELEDRDLVIIEGAGGALVRFNAAGQTLLDLAVDLSIEHRVELVLVSAAGLGVLNAAALTATAVQARSLAIEHVVIGDWPAEPGLAERCNLADIGHYAGAELAGVLPHGMAALDPELFGQVALSWLTSALGGSFDAQDFIRQNSAPLPDVKGRP